MRIKVQEFSNNSITLNQWQFDHQPTLIMQIRQSPPLVAN